MGMGEERGGRRSKGDVVDEEMGDNGERGRGDVPNKSEGVRDEKGGVGRKWNEE